MVPRKKVCSSSKLTYAFQGLVSYFCTDQRKYGKIYKKVISSFKEQLYEIDFTLANFIAVNRILNSISEN